MKRRLLLAMSLLLVSTACGSSSDSPTTTGPTNNTSARSMSAKIDGASWTATAVGVTTPSGVVILAGTNSTQTIGLSFVPTVGTQTISQFSLVIGSVTIGSQTWQASGSVAGSGGTVTVTTATANHFVGTFSFTGSVITGGTTPATRLVTAGAFDVTL